jgi:hypothetical protein
MIMESLEEFVNTVEGFDEFKSEDIIDCFTYFLFVHRSNSHFTDKQINNCYTTLRINSGLNIKKTLDMHLQVFAERAGRKTKYQQNQYGYVLTRSFEKELRERFDLKKEIPFIKYTVNEDVQEFKVSDIPFLNNDIKKHAKFFAPMYYTFYHLENSIRKFLQYRLDSLFGFEWETELISRVDLSHALRIKQESNISSTITQRGDGILFYCMWYEYANIIKTIPDLLPNENERYELLANLSAMTKIRNAIAHNVDILPSDYKDELTVFYRKYNKIIRQYEPK